MRKFVIGALLMCLVGLANAASIQFCEGIDKSFKPINANDTFVGQQFSFIVIYEKPVNQMNLVVSLYKIVDNTSQVIDRRTFPIDPICNAFGVENTTVTEYGTYKISVSKENGSDVVEGYVNLVEPKAGEPEPEIKPEKTRSQKLADIFNKYSK